MKIRSLLDLPNDLNAMPKGDGASLAILITCCYSEFNSVTLFFNFLKRGNCFGGG